MSLSPTTAPVTVESYDSETVTEVATTATTTSPVAMPVPTTMQMQMPMPIVPLPTRMALGALSGMAAASVCHPLDVVRVRLQTGGSNSAGASPGVLRTAMAAYQQGGLYAGIGAAYLRQWTYGACRMGIYSYLLEQARASQSHNDDTTGADSDSADGGVSFPVKLGMGMLSGGIGSFVGTPSELALVRLTNDGKLPPGERRNYKGVVDCLRRIALEEGGLRAWWTGATPTVCRATVMSACLMGGTSQAKSFLKSTGRFEVEVETEAKLEVEVGSKADDYRGDWLNGVPLLFCATLVSSFCANVVANPFDVVKSRMQNQGLPSQSQSQSQSQFTKGTGEAQAQALLYRGSLDCLRKSVASEGVGVLYKGFGPAFVKLAPYTVISLTMVDTMTKALTGKEAL